MTTFTVSLHTRKVFEIRNLDVCVMMFQASYTLSDEEVAGNNLTAFIYAV